MSEEYTEPVDGTPAAFPRWMRVLAAALVFSVVQAQAHSPKPENEPQAAQEAYRPQAKSQQERNDFNAAYALTVAASEEAAADDFANKYPTSELRRYLYSSAMLLYQRANNSDKMLAMGNKVLELDADNPLALVLTATALANGLDDRDPDKADKVGTVKRNAARAIQIAEASYTGPAKTTQIYKSTLQAMAYSALGIMKLKTGDDAGAEKDLGQAASLAKIHPDPYVWYHLALAQDHRKKYAAALDSIKQALQLASSDPDLQKLAEVENERLTGLVKVTHDGGATEPQ
jgi:tetratricopeptide (TPR) repeat protein